MGASLGDDEPAGLEHRLGKGREWGWRASTFHDADRTRGVIPDVIRLHELAGSTPDDEILGREQPNPSLREADLVGVVSERGHIATMRNPTPRLRGQIDAKSEGLMDGLRVQGHFLPVALKLPIRRLDLAVEIEAFGSLGLRRERDRGQEQRGEGKTLDHAQALALLA